MIPQLFVFKDKTIHTYTFENAPNDPWFLLKDIADALSIKNTSDIVNRLDDDEKNLTSIKSRSGQARNMWIVSESGLYEAIITSHKEEANVFRRWIRKEVLPSIRKTGSYQLRDYLTPTPRSWSKTYPDHYFENVLRLYGYQFKKGTNPPQFIGHFTNEYVYKALDKQMPDALKQLQQNTLSLDDHKRFMHQFLNGDGREALEKHLNRVVTIMEMSANIDQFRKMWEAANARRSGQLELYLRG